MQKLLNRRVYPASILFTLLLLSACNSRLDKLGLDDTTTPILSASEISFPAVSQYVFSKSCISCHGGTKISGNLDLRGYDGASAFGAQIKKAVDSNRMPPSPEAPLSQRQKDLVDLWVAQGMPNAPGGAPAPPRPPLKPEFASIHDGIFRFKCLTCHNPTGKGKNIKLDQPSDLLVGQNILVVPGKPESSKIVRMTSPGAKRPMPPLSTEKDPLPPEEIKTPLSPDQVAQLTSWIQDGAVDDSNQPNSRFQAIEKGIIQDKCVVCHAVGKKAEGVPIDTVTDLTGGGPPFVYPKQPEISGLLDLTKPGAEDPMPPKDSKVDPVTQEEWNIIRDWIVNGASQ